MNSIGDLLSGKRFQSMGTKKRGHFTKVYNIFIMSKQFTGYEKLIWIILKKYKMTNETCWPSHKTIAETSGWSVSTVKKALKGLEKKGMISKERSSKRKSNIYKVFDLSP